MTQTARHRPTSVQDLKDLSGRELGPTAWHTVDQSRIDGFAELTGDHQWIHVDLTARRTASFPAGVAQRIDEQVAAHRGLGWQLPLSGAMAVRR